MNITGSMAVNVTVVLFFGSDAGHQAVDITESIPHIDARKCVDCHLYSLVCPANAIEKTKRIEKAAVRK